jgi:hypothetical protein
MKAQSSVLIEHATKNRETMISVLDLQNLCTDRLEDAKTLYKDGRYEGAFYICGYVVEMGLKKKICETLGWAGYPNAGNEFSNLQSFKTHNLEILLHLSGAETKIKKAHLSDWSIVVGWNPEIRYSTQKLTAQSADAMLKASETILNNL